MSKTLFLTPAEAVRGAAPLPEAPARADSAQIAKPFIRGSIDRSSIKEEDGFMIVSVVFATETSVRRYNWKLDEYFDEVLSIDSDHMKLERLNLGGPALDMHDKYGSVRDVVLGRVVEGSATIEGKKAVAKIRLSNREELKGFRQDVQDGIVCNISVGYNIEEFTREESVNSNGVPIYRATSWEPNEISFVTVPADMNSGVRGAGDTPPQNSITIPMKYGIRAQREPQAGAAEPSAAPTTVVAPAPAPAAEGNRAQAPAPAPAPAPVDPASIVQAERTRASSIRTAVRTFGLGDELADTLVTEGVSLAVARERIQDAFSQGGEGTRNISGANPGATVRVNGDTMAAFTRAAEAGLLLRVGGRTASALTDAERTAGREFAGVSLLRMAEQAIVVSGGSVAGLSQRQIAQRALGLENTRSASGAMSTSDFPILLGNAISRTLQREYAAAPQTFDPWISRGTLSDFRKSQRARISELLSDFAKVQENGEYTYNSVSENSEYIQLAKYGTVISITWEALVNDDLGAFNRLPTAAARKSKNLQADLVYGVLLDNKKMNDGQNLFSAAHGNMGTAAKVGVDSLSQGRKAMRTQKAFGESKAQMNLRPKFIIVGPELETEVEQFLSGLYLPTKQGDINVFQNRLTPIVESRITDRSWYLIADPAEVDTVELDFLAGEPELFTEERWAFDRDAYEIKNRTVVGAAAPDYRGVYYNKGV